jgi:hypothetical protein
MLSARGSKRYSNWYNERTPTRAGQAMDIGDTNTKLTTCARHCISPVTGLDHVWQWHIRASLQPVQQRSSIAATAPERRTQLAVLVREIQDRLRQVGRLDNTADLDGPFFLDEFADHVQEFGGELALLISFSPGNVEYGAYF